MYVNAVEPVARMFTCACGIAADPYIKRLGTPDNVKEGLQSYQTDLVK
jgi:hypothetical protein